MPTPTAAQTLLLCHFDGDDDATESLDSSGRGNVLSFGSGAKLATEQKKFGSACLESPGDDTGYVTIDLTSVFADWDFTATDFTIEYWYRSITTAGADQAVGFGPSGEYHVSHLHSNNNMFMEYSLTGTTVVQTDSGHNITDATWTHFAYVKNGNDLDIYMDGVKGATTKDITGVTFAALTSAARFFIGRTSNGYIDELRVSTIAVYTENFTPDTQAFTDPATSSGERDKNRDPGRTLRRNLNRALVGA